MDCTDQHNSEPSCSSPAVVSALQEATGDSESDLAADGWSVHVDDGDTGSCSGGEDGGSMELGVVVSWGCWATEQSASAADCTDQHNTEPSCSSPAVVSALREATGDSESDLAADGWSVHVDDGDAGSCSGGEDGGSMELGVVVPWGCWATEQSASAAPRHVAPVGGDDGVCPAAEDAAAGDAESDKLFWEACIAHGY